MVNSIYEYTSHSDRDIMGRIQKVLRMNEDTAEELDSINIRVVDGRVHLTGTVSSLEIQERICDIIENTYGVVEVIDDLLTEKI